MCKKRFAPGPYHLDQDRIMKGNITLAHVAEDDGVVWFTDLEDEKAKAAAALFVAAPDLYEALEGLRRAYVNLLETGHDRIISCGGDCDPVDVMEARDPHLRVALKALARARGEEASHVQGNELRV